MSAEMRAYELYSPRSALGPHRANDYWKLPEDTRSELIYGRFYVSPSPTALHQIVSHLLGEFLWRVARRPGGVVLVAPMDVILAEHSIVQPDLLYVTPERRWIVKDKVEEAPDLVVEIVSTQAGRRDRVEKLRLYGEAGVKEYWIVDPVERTFEFLVCHEGTFQVALPLDDRYQSPALPELQINLCDFWGEIDARMQER